MTQDYTDRLRQHSYESRVDPLRDVVRHAVDVWHQEDEQAKKTLSWKFWEAMTVLENTLRSVKRGGEPEEPEEVPEVEVTISGSSDLVSSPERPVEGRRSGAKNVSDPKYQEAFISEARASMGQPTKQEAIWLVGKSVEIKFNVDWPDVRGVLTDVVDHPVSPTYLILDDDTSSPIPLNSIQSIKLSEH